MAFHITTTTTTTTKLVASVVLLVIIARTGTVVASTAFDHDTRENCDALIAESSSPCIEQDTSRLYFQCPISCAKALRRRTVDDDEESSEARNKHGHSQNPDPFYDSSIMIMSSNNEFKMLSCDRFEGYVTLVATVPMLSSVGFVQFHYEMLQHIHSVFPYTIEILFLPLLLNDDTSKNKKKKSSSDKKKSSSDKDNHVFQYLEQITTQKTMTIEKNGSGQEDKIVVAEPVKKDAATNHPVLQYLLNPIYGPPNKNILSDRKAATFYVMSIDGRHWEELISPTLTDVELVLSKFLHELDPPIEHIPIE